MPHVRLLAVVLIGIALPVPHRAGTGSPTAPADRLPPLACTQTRQSRLVASGLGGELATLATRNAAPPRDAGGRVTGAAGSFSTATAGVAIDGEAPKWVRVQSPGELEDTLRSSFTGTVVVPREVFWDMTGRSSIPLATGVALVGERGVRCSRPTLYTNTIDEKHALFEVSGNGVRVEGIHFRGPAGGNRSAEQPYVTAIQVVVDRAQGLGRGILVADNEFDEWTGSGVDVQSTMQVRTPAQYDPAWPRPTRADAELIRIERNYMHHNARDGGGYGVTVGGGAYAMVWGNLFDANRHAIASDGFAFSGYIARFNYVLQGGFKQGGFYNQHFDVHGTNPIDTTDRSSGYGGTAGEYYEIALNTFRGDQGYYVVKTRPALELRGAPTEGAWFDGNVLVHEDLDAAVSLKSYKDEPTLGEDHEKYNFSASGNHFDTDYSSEMATGDFDGDGLTDIFLANGTAWWVSRGGVEPWQFLHASTKRLSELGFADMDNDGVTDVVWRAPNGDLGYLRSGAGEVLPLTISPVPVKELRFGDFDGDQRTDIFRRESSGRWMIWYGHTRTWTAGNRSVQPLSALRFGEFDSLPGTDVVTVLADRWAVSSAATASWERLNGRLLPSFRNAVVADFDGDGRSDLAFDLERQQWSYSSGGRGPLRELRDGAGQTPVFHGLTTMLIGRFDEAEPGDQVATFWDPYGMAVGEWTDRFVVIRTGRGRTGFVLLSRASMR